jgi:microcystin-dependent protein
MTFDLPVTDFRGATRAFEDTQKFLTPTGAIVQFPGDIPSGWLECDGTTFDRVQYPALSRVIGGTGTTFAVPLLVTSPPSIIKV